MNPEERVHPLSALTPPEATVEACSNGGNTSRRGQPRIADRGFLISTNSHRKTDPEMSSYTPAERRSYELERLEEQGHLSVNDLSEKLGVSTATIRKDLQFLEDQSLLIRTHGGAIARNGYAFNISVDEKAQRQEEEKRQIGKAGAKRINDRDTLILDAGTTTLQIARNLDDPSGLTVATHSLHVASEMLGTSEINLLLLGGTVRSKSASTVGPYAEEMIRDHSFRKLFLAGDGFDLSHGLTTTNDQEAHLNRLMIESAEKTIVVVDSTKFGRRGLCRICKTSEIDAVITDDGIPNEVASELRKRGSQLIIA